MSKIKVESRLVSETNERKILRVMEVSEEVAVGILDEVTSDFFTSQERIKLFNIYKKLVLEGNSIIESKVLPRISTEPSLVGVYLSLRDETVSVIEIDSYIEELTALCELRKLQDLSIKLSAEVNSSTKTSTDILDTIQKSVMNITDTDGRESDKIEDILDVVIPDIDDIQPIIGLQGITTGFKELDSYTSGFCGIQLITLAARPSMGKTEMALQMMCSMAQAGDAPIVFISLETDKKSIVQRLLAHLSGIDSQIVKSRRFKNNEQKQKYIQAYKKLKTLPIYILDDPVMTTGRINSKLRRIQYQSGKIGCCFIDYVQLIKGSGKTQSRVQELSAITRDLKVVCKQIGVPIVILSQLSREIENRNEGWRSSPRLSDLRESGGIEQDSDIVLFITSEEKDSDGNQLEKRNAILWLSKQKDGPKGSIELINHCNVSTFVEEGVTSETVSRGGNSHAEWFKNN